MTRSVADGAIILTAIAGRDPRDNFTLAQPPVVPDFTKALKADGLQGVRLGVPRRLFSRTNANIVAAFDAALDTIRELGATIVDPADLPDFDELQVSDNETIVLQTDFKVRPGKREMCGCEADGDPKVEVKQYIDGLLEVPTGVKDLADLIQFNIDHADEELVQPFWTDQSEYVRCSPLPCIWLMFGGHSPMSDQVHRVGKDDHGSDVL